MASTDFPFSVEAIYFAMNEHLLEIRIVQPGRITGQYYAVTPDTLRLEKIVYPAESIPFDVGILPTALTPFGEPLVTLVLGNLSHPVSTEMEGRLLGAVQRRDGIPILLVTPTTDERAIHCLDELTADQRVEIVVILQRTYPGQWQWLSVEEVELQLHAATLRYRQKQAGVCYGY